MSVTYPRDLRILINGGVLFTASRFTPRRRVTATYLPAKTQVMETAPPVWVAEYTTAPLDESLHSEVTAFLDSLGGAKTFLACDPKHMRARAAGLPETTSVSALGTARITLSMANGLSISAGDLVGLEQAGRYGLFRVLETVTASTGSVAFDVHAPIPPFFTTAALARLTAPVCEMILDPASPPDYQAQGGLDSVSFKAIQRLV